MKQIISLLTMALLLFVGSIGARAQYQADSDWGYQPSSVFYIDVLDIDGNSITANYHADTYVRYAIGAYVDGVLRGVGKADPVTNTKYVFTVRVDCEDISGSEVEFRMYDTNSTEYIIGNYSDIDLSQENTVGTPSNPLTFTFAPVTGVEISPNPIEVTVGNNASFSANLLPKNHSQMVEGQETRWEFQARSETNIAPFTVDGDKLSVTGTAVGTGTLMAIFFSGNSNGLRGTATVNVTEQVIDVTGITAGEESTDITMYVGDTFYPQYVIQPENASNKNVTLTAGDATILGSIDNGSGVEALKAGTTTLTVTTEDGGFSVVYTITVKKRVESIELNAGALTIVRDTKFQLTADMFTVEPADADFDFSQMSFISDYETIGEALAGLWVIGDDGKTIIGFTPYTYQLSYAYGDDPDYIIEGEFEVRVQDKVKLGAGWNWIGTPYAYTTEDILKQAGENFIEARSKTQLVYNDESYGLFGDLTNIVATTGYKVKTAAATDLIFDVTDDTWLYEETSVATTRGWNWLGNVLPRATTTDDIMSEVFDGDIVKTLDGMATYTDGEGWSSVLEIGEHEGFLYKSSEGNLQITFDPVMCFDSEEYTSAIINGNTGGSGIKAQSIWQYEVGSYPTNMGIIASSDVLADASRFTIGAFVGDECRGKGTLQKGRWFIVAHAQSGEQISLRLYDHQTGEFSPLFIDGNESIRFAEIAGSMKAPLQLSGPAVTAITATKASPTVDADAIYNLAGQRVERTQKGLYIVGGKKVLVK